MSKKLSDKLRGQRPEASSGRGEALWVFVGVFVGQGRKKASKKYFNHINHAIRSTWRSM